MLVNIRNYWNLLPDFSLSHILLRIPLALIFIQQGLSKMPFDPAGGEAFGLPALIWWVVVFGEVAAGLGLLLGALTTLPGLRDNYVVAVTGDTRGFVETSGVRIGVAAETTRGHDERWFKALATKMINLLRA